MAEIITKVKAPALLISLLSLFIFLFPAPIQAAGGLTLNPTEGLVNSEVTIYSICSYGNGEYQIYWGESQRLLTQGNTEGCTAVTFSIPEAARGKHKVILKVESETYEAQFKILPSISLSAAEGSVEDKLIVTGTGFDANETDIKVTYDNVPVELGIKSDNKGTWQSTVKVPASNAGEHIIDAMGNTPANDVDDRIFSVIPKIRISPESGGVGTMVTVDGSGFSDAETGISVIYDGLAVKTSIAAGELGSWRSSFFIPASTKGRHEVDAYGSDTEETVVTGVFFTVSPAIKLELVSGLLGDPIHTGDELWVSGIGFEKNEAGIQVTFDGTMLASGITADAKGSWAVQLHVPASSTGRHNIDSSGDTTRANDIADAVLIITPQIEINPESGAIEDDVVINGTGFGENQLLTINYAGNQVAPGSTTDSKGNFTTSFKIPISEAGDHIITVTDAMASVSSVTFNLESTPPPVPALITPEAGSSTGFFGKTVVAFDWADVDDPSGVYYVLEISVSMDFSGAMLHKESLLLSEYTLTEEEALDKGEYYWRVKAIDGAGNESNWTAARLLKVGVMDLWLFIVAILGVIIVLAIVWRVVSMIRRK